MKKNVYLFELSDIFANQVYLPYSSGVVWSYCKNKELIRDNYVLKDWFYFREEVDEICNKIDSPDVLGFSCFMWNWNLNCQIAKKVKESHPDCLIVFGGQHQPLSDRSEGFFQLHPYVDVIVHHEGEESFYEILVERLSDKPNFSNIAGITLNEGGKEFKSRPRPRIKDVQNCPSPYLDGSFDRLISENTTGLLYSAIVESSRGCPFSCAFCEIGEKYYSKVRYAHERTKQEIDWIAANKIEYVTDANSNYGLSCEADYDLACYVRDIKSQYQYPDAYRVTWVKGKADRVLNIAKIFEECGAQKGMTIALQSMNPSVLRAIKRRNIDGGKLQEFIELYESENIGSYVELIWGLPEETLDSFVNGVGQIMKYGYHNYLDIHLMMLLPNAPIGSDEYLETYGIKTSTTQPRFSHRHITEELNVDTVEFVTETNKLTVEEWVEGHQFRWAVIFGHYLGPLQFVARGLNKIYGIPLQDFYLQLLQFSKKNEKTFIGIEYNSIKENLSKILQNKRHWGYVLDDTGDINWAVEEATCIRLAQGSNKDRFYSEIMQFILKEYPRAELGVLEDIFKYQKCRVSDPNTTYPLTVAFDHNIHGVIEGDQVLSRVNNAVVFEAKNYNGNLFDWAKEVLWYGRRIGKYKTSARLGQEGKKS